MSFRLKTVLGIALIEVVVMVILIAINQFALGGTAATQLFERTEATANVFANTVSDAVISTDLATIDAAIESAVSTADLSYIRVLNDSGIILSQGGQAEALEREFVPDLSFDDGARDGLIDISVPIILAGTAYGAIELGMSTMAVEAEVRTALYVNIAVMIVGMSLVAIFGLGLGTMLTRQLEHLRDGAQRISDGDLSTRVKVRGKDELAYTADCFNRMAAALDQDRTNLQAKQEELLRKKARVDEMVDRMTCIAAGNDSVSIPFTDLDDEIGDMARATEVFNRSMREVRKGKLELQRLITAFDQVAEQVAIFEFGGKALFLNAAFRDFNRSILDALPDTFTIHEFLREGVAQGAFPEAKENPRAWIRNQLRRTDTNPVEVKRAPDRVLLTLQSIVDGIGVVLSAKDVTDLRRSEGQLVQASKLATLGEMATGIAHELNQPLGVIRMASSNCIKRIDKGFDQLDFYRGKFDRIEEQTTRAAQIIDHMRVFGRKADGNMAPFDLRAAVVQSVEFARSQFHTNDISVSLNLPEEHALVLGEQVIFEQVLLNLLSNARDAIVSHPQDDGKIEIVAEFGGKDGHIIQVTDTGGGVPEEILDKLFEPFFTTKDPGQGTGLGLSISFGTIRDMGGTISVVNSGQGACFTIALPDYGHETAEAV